MISRASMVQYYLFLCGYNKSSEVLADGSLRNISKTFFSLEMFIFKNLAYKVLDEILKGN